MFLFCITSVSTKCYKTNRKYFICWVNCYPLYKSEILKSLSRYLSVPLFYFLPGLQGGVGEPDPGAAAEGEQPNRPAGPQTDCWLLHGQLGGRLQHLPPQWVLTALWAPDQGHRTLTLSTKCQFCPCGATFDWTETQNTAVEFEGRRTVLKHEVCVLRGRNTPRRPNPRLRKSCTYFSGVWSFLNSVQESICEVC